MLSEAVWDIFASLGEILVSLATVMARIMTSKPLNYCMTVINGALKTDRFAHVLTANQRFWRYVNNIRRFLGMEIRKEATAGEAPPEEEEEEDEDDGVHPEDYLSTPEHFHRQSTSPQHFEHVEGLNDTVLEDSRQLAPDVLQAGSDA